MTHALENVDSSSSRRVILETHSIASASSHQDLGPQQVALIMDIMGTAIKSDDTFTITSYPAGTFKLITEFLLQGRLRLNTEFVVFHLGTNIVTDFTCSDTIGKVIRLCQVTKQKYPTIKIYFSTLFPRPIDHDTTARSVINFNDAIKTGTTVANRRYSPVKYISNHQLFTHTDGSFKSELYHKLELRLSKKGVQVFKQNIRAALHLSTS